MDAQGYRRKALYDHASRSAPFAAKRHGLDRAMGDHRARCLRTWTKTDSNQQEGLLDRDPNGTGARIAAVSAWVLKMDPAAARLP
jgi:hypothetical protein